MSRRREDETDALVRLYSELRHYSAGRRDEAAFLRAALGGLSRRQAARPIGVDRLNDEEVQVVMDKEAERHIDGGVISDDDEDARPQAPLSRRRLKSRSCARQ
jgi:hypothetical protein